MKHRNFLNLRIEVFVTFVFIILISWSNSWALYQTDTSGKSAAEVKSLTQVETEIHENFLGLGFGWGLSVSFGGKEKVESAELVNEVVRVSKSVNLEPRLILETHFLFGLKKYKKKDSRGQPLTKTYAEMANLDFGAGPFICLSVSEDELIKAFGGGLMFGVRKKGAENSFNVGIGIINDTDYKVLGDDIEANKPLPNGETEIRYKTKNQWRWLIVFAFRF